jgi:biopolymer transport protein TolQ
MKWRILKRALEENDIFTKTFWASKSIDAIMAQCDQFTHSPVASLFQSGVKELKKNPISDQPGASSERIDNIHRSLIRSTSAEISQLEKHIHWLATTASAAPYVGLFGTVWGIINSFQSIGFTGTASLAVVAPGISEALITTAAGIGAAIPAVVAYNYFVGKVKKIAIDMDCFSQDFMNIVQRNSTHLGKKL